MTRDRPRTNIGGVTVRIYKSERQFGLSQRQEFAGSQTKVSGGRSGESQIAAPGALGLTIRIAKR